MVHSLLKSCRYRGRPRPFTLSAGTWSSSPLTWFLLFPFEIPSNSQTSLSNYHSISQLELLLIKSLCLEGLIQRNPSGPGPFGDLSQAILAVTAARALVHTVPHFSRGSEEEFDGHEKILRSCKSTLGVIRGGEETEGFILCPFLPLLTPGLSQVEQYLLRRCHEESPFEISVADLCFSISCILSSCGMGHYGAFPEEGWT